MSPSDTNPHVPNLALPVSEVAIYKVLCITELPAWGERARRPLERPLPLLDVLAPATPVPAPAADTDVADVAEPEADLADTPGGPEAGSAEGAYTLDGPAEGVLLTYEQAWRMKGVALGRLHHSLCLAPGEVTQVAVTEWSRTTTGSATEDQAAEELASKSVERQRQTTAITEAVASERQQAGSSTDAIASSSSIAGGGAFGLWGASASASHASAHGATAEYQVGVRNVSASALNRVRQSTHQQASSARQRTASLMQEVTETESETSMTRVVANYNHMHALNMQYYEVVQVFELASRVTAAERCVFVPMEVMDFDEATIRDFAGTLRDAARALARPVLFHAIDQLWDEGRDPLPRLTALRDAAKVALDAQQAVLDAARSALQLAEADASTALKALEAATAAVDAARGPADVAEHLKAMHHQLSNLHLPMGVPDLADLHRWRSLLNNLHQQTTFGLPLGFHRSSSQLGPLRKQARAVLSMMDQLHGKSVDEAIQDLDDARTVEASAQSAWRPKEAARVAATTARDDAEKALRPLQDSYNNANTAHTDAESGRALTIDAVRDALNDHKLWFNQWLWRRITPPQVAALLGRREYPAGSPLIEQIEPEVIGVQDHYIAFRRPFSTAQAAERRAFERQHLGGVDRSGVRETIALPTGGLFAEAVLGTSNAAEKLDLTRFWKWDDNTIPIVPTAIRALRQRVHERADEARPSEAEAPSLQIEDLPDWAPAARASLGAAASAPLFRDMADSQQIADLLAHTMEQAATMDSELQAEAQANAQAYQEHLVKMIPIAQNALAQGADLDPSSLGGLGNLIGDGELDIGALLGTAAKLGLLL